MTKTRILIVDEDTRQRENVVRAAREMGLDTVEAVSDEEAYKLIETTMFPLAVVDITVADRPEDLKVIEHLRYKQPTCRIIALTARAGQEFGIGALQAGADDVVATKWKYINWSNLLQQRMALWREVGQRGNVVVS